MARSLYRLPNNYTNTTSYFQLLTNKCCNSHLPHKNSIILPKATMENTNRNENKTMKVVKLNAIEATPQNFKDYGQLIQPTPDSQVFGPHDAQLDLSNGTPRFYIMNLQDRELKFSNITHHANVTQCLGTVGGDVWYLGVAKPSVVNPSIDISASSKKISKSSCGHLYVPPSVEEIRVFKIEGTKFVKLNAGTWHAGPLFLPKSMDFYNLELTDTNVVDHTTHDFGKEDGVCFEFDP